MCFLLLLLFFGALSKVDCETHSLRYLYTATSGIPNFPEFVDVGMLNGQEISYYDSITKKKVPKQDWMKENFNQEYWDSSTKTDQEAERLYKINIQSAMKRFNQTKGVHIFQTRYGCDWDEETGITDGFHQSGYDGEDFLVFDLKTLSWIALVPQAVQTKRMLDSDPSYNYRERYHLTEECIYWLKNYVDYGRSTLRRTVSPSVSLLQKTPSSPVTCHATGFYPSRVMVTWQKDGQDFHEDVELGEALPNDDGTFQNSVHLTVKPEEWKNNQYQCVVQGSGIKEYFIKVLTEKEIQTNWGKTNRGVNYSPIIGVVVSLLLVLVVVVAAVGVVIWKKKRSRNGDVPANSSEGGSNSSTYIFQQEVLD
ncbi:hypothetical protein UPYG_G00338930 [Umbra pygmaea]|uniref:Ig-like domain-containing protein n=1 Tax=Umbra pygmaea TaxID=75934 RepID=A0ABD0VWD6_UMBPY